MFNFAKWADIIKPTPPTLQQPLDNEEMREAIIANLRTILDPEIPVNIYDLGLVYEIDIKRDQKVEITMTLTSPGCPVAGTMPRMVAHNVAKVPGVKGARVHLVWDPPWSRDKMSLGAMVELGMI
ncbi:MAG: DUF59 domain-containing protein [Magnetococcales bacterium]|nr:DUF59 domain-containing protein [Magnetococcales bacterium]